MSFRVFHLTWKAHEPLRNMQTVTRKLLFLFYLFTQARHIKHRLSLAAIQPAVGKKPIAFD